MLFSGWEVGKVNVQAEFERFAEFYFKMGSEITIVFACFFNGLDVY